MDFKFGRHVPRVGSDTTRGKIFEKGAWPVSRDPVNVWALNANTIAKGTKHRRITNYGAAGVRVPLRGSRDGDTLIFWPLNANK